MAKSIVYIILYALLNVSGAALIKLKLKNLQLTALKEWMKFIIDPVFFIAVILIILSALALFKSLSTNQFSLIIPIATGVNFMLTIAVGYIIFHDKLSFISTIGILMIIGGILVLSLNHQKHA